MIVEPPMLVELPDCGHARQSGALRLDSLQTILAFTVCDDCGAVVRSLPAHTAEACSLICHQALITSAEESRDRSRAA
jgi:hypothetical protein